MERQIFRDGEMIEKLAGFKKPAPIAACVRVVPRRRSALTLRRAGNASHWRHDAPGCH